MTDTRNRPPRDSYLVFGAPYIGEEERAEVLACLDSGWIGSGPRASQLEREFSAYVGAKHAVALNSATAALFLALKSLKLSPGAEVIAPSMTFCATVNAIVHAGFKPVLVDCDRDTMNMDPAALRGALTPKTEAVLPVHFAGRPCEMKDIMTIVDEKKLALVEDCAHAVESTYEGKHCGTFGDFGAFSFYVTKNMSTAEGGMLISRKADDGDALRCKALHGLSKDAWNRFSDEGYVHYAVHEPGFKFNLTDLAASLGLHQLRRLDRAHAYREKLWTFYMRELADLPLTLPAPIPDNMRHAYHLFTCCVDDTKTRIRRDDVITGLHRLNIGSGVHYIPVHAHPYYRETLAVSDENLPNASYIGERTFSIPLSMAVTQEDAADVVAALRRVFQ